MDSPCRICDGPSKSCEHAGRHSEAGSRPEPRAINDEYRRQVTAALFVNPNTNKVEHCALGIAGEAGEIADLVKKAQYMRPRPLTREDVLNEGGDLLWYLVNFAALHNVTVDDMMIYNIAKLKARHGEDSPSWGIYDAGKLCNHPAVAYDDRQEGFACTTCHTLQRDRYV